MIDGDKEGAHKGKIKKGEIEEKEYFSLIYCCVCVCKMKGILGGDMDQTKTIGVFLYIFRPKPSPPTV